jgi:3-isopropylmalate/(R)-2-methylmalate dehydratase small subunit
VNANPALEVTLDLDAREIRFGDQVVKATIRETDRDALVNGRWDAIGELLDGRAAIQTTAAKLPYLAV